MRLRGLAVLTMMVTMGCAETAGPSSSALPPRRPWNVPREQLDRGDIVYGMQQAKGGVMRCFDRYKKMGMYEAALTIVGSGRVTRVNVRGPDVETNDCIGHAVANATFPSFSGAPRSIVYPYVLR